MYTRESLGENRRGRWKKLNSSCWNCSVLRQHPPSCPLRRFQFTFGFLFLLLRLPSNSSRARAMLPCVPLTQIIPKSSLTLLEFPLSRALLPLSFRFFPLSCCAQSDHWILRETNGRLFSSPKRNCYRGFYTCQISDQPFPPFPPRKR